MLNLSSLSLTLCLSLLPFSGGGDDSAGLRVGDTAPEFLLPGATRDTLLFPGVRLTEALAGGPVILAFYPADWSGGCTTEMCTFRDQISELGTLGAAVYAISGDYVFSHREWARRLDLPFVLLSDHDHTVAKRYLSYNEKSGMNYRTVYVIARDGTIAYIDLGFTAGSKESFANLQSAVVALR